MWLSDERESHFLSSFSANSSRQLDVFRHDCDAFRVNGAQVGVLEEADKVSFGGFLEGSDGCALKAKIRFEVLGNFTNQTLERKLPDQQFGTLLVSPDFTKSYRTRPITMRLLYTSRGRRALTSCLGGQLLPRSFSSSGLTSGLLCTCHFCL